VIWCYLVIPLVDSMVWGYTYYAFTAMLRIYSLSCSGSILRYLCIGSLLYVTEALA
jgi:hypothetical protein